MAWKCSVCGYEYNDEFEDVPFKDLPGDWKCPVCNAPKEAFSRIR